MRYSPVGSTMATRRTIDPSPNCQRIGKAAKVERLLVDADRLDPALAQPDPRLLVEAGGVDEVLAVVGVVVVPAGVDDHEVAGADLGAGGLEVVRGDDLPLPLGDRDR